MDLYAATKAVVDELTAAGVRATLDGTDVHPPCVLVRPPSVSFRFGKGNWDAEFEAWVMVPSNGIAASLRAIGDLITEVQDALADRTVTAVPDDAQLVDGGTVPMYRLSWTQRVPA